MSRLLCVSLLLLCPSFGAQAFESFSLTFDSIEFEGLSASDISIRFAWVDSGHIDLTVTSGHIDSEFPGQITQLRIQCRQASFKAGKVVCDHGNLIYRHDILGRITGEIQFTYHLQEGLVSMSVNTALSAGGRLDISYNKSDQGWRSVLKIKEISATQIQELLPHYQSFQGHILTSGTMNGSVGITGHNRSVDTIKMTGKTSDLGVDGTNIFEGVTLTLDLVGQKEGESWHIENDAMIQQGAMYLTPGIEVLGDKPGFYLEVQDKPVLIHAGIDWLPEERIEISDLIIEHPDLMQLHARELDVILDNLTLHRLDLVISVQDLANAFPVYIQPLLLQTNFSDMEVSGAVDLHIDYTDDLLNRFVLKLQDLYIDDTLDRYSLSGVTANISLGDQKASVDSGLLWEGMSLYRLDFGPGVIKFESSGKNIRVVDWQDVEILDGTLQINNLSLNNVGTSDFELFLDGILTPVSMQAFTQAIGWPLFSGKLSSVISGLKYSHNKVDIDGDILVRVFNGDVILRGLQIQDIFSDYSTLTTDIEIHGLDLEQLTDTFAFGKIEGSLSGRMEGLRLEDWQPAYFEAAFASPGDDGRPHRISQKALENLNQIGGGLSGTLSNGFLRFFPSYSYGRIGFSCRLSNGICELGGVEETADGFYLLTRGGILPPWVDVRGTGRSIKWDDLIGGLKRIAEGEISYR